MALWLCLGCTTKYAVGLFRCPRCHGTEFVEDGQPMPKITNAGGASNAGQALVEGFKAGLAEQEANSFPGNSSSASTPTPETSSEPSAPKTRRRAQTTASPSSEDPTGSSTAPTTVGESTEPTSEIASDAGE